MSNNNFIFKTESGISKSIYSSQQITNNNETLSEKNISENDSSNNSQYEIQSEKTKTELSKLSNSESPSSELSHSESTKLSGSEISNSELNNSDLSDSEPNGNFNTECNSEYQDRIFNKYIKYNKIKCTKFCEEIKDIDKKTNLYSTYVIKNNLNELKKNINTKTYLFKNEEEHIIKICSNKNCNKLSCSKECYKNDLYKSFWNFNRGIKTIYNMLFKILLTHQNFRIQCKCCENHLYTNYLNELDKKFISTQKISNIFENIPNNFEPNVILELNINFLINKFMGVLGILDCECKFKNKYCSLYTHDYLNYSNIIKTYIKTIPLVIKLLKTYFKIKDNHEELVLIDDSRCIHEDIRFNNLTNCLKKKSSQVNKKYLIEMVMKLDLVNNWVIDSIKITNILLNQQSLEYFMYYCEKKPYKLINKFEQIYDLNNNYLDLNYMSNKNNIIKIINLNCNKFKSQDIEKLLSNIYKQLINRNKYITNYDVNAIIINYIYECINYKNITIAFKWLKYIKNIQKNQYDEHYQVKFELEKIFNSLLDNDILNTMTKISYLKIINKNKINIIEFDFVNKLIDLKIGDTIILEFDKEENSLFNIKDYKNETYIKEIIKKCIHKNKVNILDYILFKLNKSITEYNIDIISIYLLDISNKSNEIDCEFSYINLLKMIIKYYVTSNVKLISSLENKKYTPLEYCIENNLYLSAYIFIQNSIDINLSTKKDFNLLLNCFEKSNTIIFEYILNSNQNLITNMINGLNIFTYLFIYYEKKIISDSNVLYIFLHKILAHIYMTKIGLDMLNFQDELNELVGFKILNVTEFNSEEKTTLFKIIKNYLNPLEINTFIKKNLSLTTFNYPLIIHSMLLEELEITFLLLNNLLTNGFIKKNLTSSESSKIYDYYLVNNSININFIPIIFKYIKDNRDKCNNFEQENSIQMNKNLNLNFTKGTINNIIILLVCLKFILFFVIIKNNSLTNNKISLQSNFNNNLPNNYNDTNKYVEITLSSENNPNQLNTITNIEENSDNVYNQNQNNLANKYKHKIFKETQKIQDKNVHKNIWVSTSSNNNNNKINITQLSEQINLSDSLDSIGSSKLSNQKNNINNLYKIGMIDSNEFEIFDSDIIFGFN